MVLYKQTVRKMKKYIVLSVNGNPEYMFYLPLTVWAWRKFGWQPIVFYHRSKKSEKISDLENLITETCEIGNSEIHFLKSIDGYRSETIAQISRLYATCVIGHSPEDYIMTGDIDMIPLSDYWDAKQFDVTVWGHDLTDYQHYPICYIGMNAWHWYCLMNISGNPGDYNEMIKRDLDSMPNAKSEDSVKRWVVDQDLITERLNSRPWAIEKIHRGVYPNGYPVGRVDRSAWTLDHPELIDCHMLRGIWKDPRHMRMTMDLLQKVWPNEDFGWLEKYTAKFNQLING
jgi:hypothetical protein